MVGVCDPLCSCGTGSAVTCWPRSRIAAMANPCRAVRRGQGGRPKGAGQQLARPAAAGEDTGCCPALDPASRAKRLARRRRCRCRAVSARPTQPEGSSSMAAAERARRAGGQVVRRRFGLLANTGHPSGSALPWCGIKSGPSGSTGGGEAPGARRARVACGALIPGRRRSKSDGGVLVDASPAKLIPDCGGGRRAFDLDSGDDSERWRLAAGEAGTGSRRGGGACISESLRPL
jgi:hypothetical protein